MLSASASIRAKSAHHSAMKRIVRLLSLLLACVMLAGCAASAPKTEEETVAPVEESAQATATPEPTPFEEKDYAIAVQPGGDSVAVSQEVTVKSFIDGDTVHFYVPTETISAGVLKARFLAINTPESTGRIEEYGKAASTFTKEKLSNASSILVESDDLSWNIDSTGDRYLVWIWYKPEGSDSYRNLNIELLQNGLAQPYSAANNRYGSICTQALEQAKTLKLNLYSGEKDPDFYYGDAVELTLKELRTHITDYVGMKVAVEGNIVANYNNSVYIEDYDEETGLYFGISAYYGFSLSGTGMNILSLGNRSRIVGSVQYYEGGGIYQISGMNYREIKPDDPGNLQKITDGMEPAYAAVTAKMLAEDTAEIEDASYPIGELILHTTVSLTDLLVKEVQLPAEGSDSSAVTLLCEQDGVTVLVRAENLPDEIEIDALAGKSIDVKGLVDCYNGNTQVRVFSKTGITLH